MIEKLHPMLHTPIPLVFSSIKFLFFCCNKPYEEDHEIEERERKVQNERLVSSFFRQFSQNKVIAECGGEFIGTKEFPLEKHEDVLDDGSNNGGGGHKDKDPYDALGSGFQAYFKMLRVFALLFLVFAVCMHPAILIYES